MEKRRNQGQMLTVLVFAFFLFMMLYHLTNSALWGDEWTEWHYSQYPILSGDMYKAICSTFQPPLYNFLMYFWLKLGSSVLWFRLFNVFLGMGSALFLFAAVRSLTSHKVALFTLAVFGLSYQWVYCIQECSEYALMLFYLFGAFYYFSTNSAAEMTLPSEVGFILMNVGAMYSQYGAFFCVAPLLILHLAGRIRTKNAALIKRTVLLYAGAFVIFAVPLYWFFLRFQLGNAGESERDFLSGFAAFGKDMPAVMGGLIQYFYHCYQNFVPKALFTVLGLAILCVALFVACSRKVNEKSRELAIALLTAYILFVVLVDLKIYAMTHPNVSAGFYARYAYFFLPLFSIGLPTLFCEIIRVLLPVKLQGKARILLGVCMAVIAFVGLPMTLNNWHKAYDDAFARIWVENTGFADDTYVPGIARYGFNYYVGQSGCKVTGELWNTFDYENLTSDRFWVWRTNWSGSDWQKIIDYAGEHGYKVEIFADHGYSGQLARCTKISEE